ncbi:putative efflux protein, MATE family [Lachnospiraceae bacterium NK3A20]|nr:putative efflux protein, MATE family [Lachnospiraceae bacterium NK3A20]
MGTDLTRGKPLSVIVKFMIPLFIGNVFQQLYNMADTVIVGRYVGQNALAAVGSTGTIMFLVLGFATGLTTGFTVLTSQRYGAKDAVGTRKSVANAMILAVIVIAVMTLVSLLVMRPVLTLMNTPAEIYEDAYRYISIICGGIFCTVFYNLFSAMMRSVGNSRMPLVFLVMSACLNVVLDLVFIINFHMGTAGAAIATDVAQGISAVLSILYMIRKMPELMPERHMWRLTGYMTRVQLQVGLPMALQFGITASGTMVMQAAINTFGAVAVASFTAAGKVQNLITQEFSSMGQSMASYCGQNYGKGDYERIQQGVRSAILVSVIYSIAAAIVGLTLLRPMMGLFFPAGTDIAGMMPYANTYIRLCVIFYIPLSMIFIFRNAMQGCGYGFLPMMGGVVELFCRLAMALASMALNIYALAAFCDPFAWIGACIFTAIAYRIVIGKVRATLLGTGANPERLSERA